MKANSVTCIASQTHTHTHRACYNISHGFYLLTISNICARAVNKFDFRFSICDLCDFLCERPHSFYARNTQPASPSLRQFKRPPSELTFYIAYFLAPRCAQVSCNFSLPTFWGKIYWFAKRTSRRW